MNNERSSVSLQILKETAIIKKKKIGKANYHETRLFVINNVKVMTGKMANAVEVVTSTVGAPSDTWRGSPI
jgi:hypothetical protein